VSGTEIDAVRTWLLKEGYPLEYETHREMVRVGYRAWQGLYYTDGEVRREIDVQAVEPDEPETAADPKTPYVYVVVECKNNSKPWLALMNVIPLNIPGYGSHSLVSNRDSHVLREKYAPSDADFLMNIPELHGYNVIQALAGPDVAHAALQSVTKAAFGTIDRFKREPRPVVAWPVIVLGGSLYQVMFHGDGSEVLQRTECVRVLWRGSVASDERALQVDVTTRQYLPTYMARLRAATRALKALLSQPKSP
jgi:hypothetical protein